MSLKFMPPTLRGIVSAVLLGGEHPVLVPSIVSGSASEATPVASPQGLYPESYAWHGRGVDFG